MNNSRNEQKCVRDIINQYKFKLETIITAAQELKMDKIYNENSFVNSFQIDKIVTYISKQKNDRANANNPNYGDKQKKATNPTKQEQSIKQTISTGTNKKQRTVQDVVKEYNIPLKDIFEIAKKLNFPKFYNEDSHVYDDQLKKILEYHSNKYQYKVIENKKKKVMTEFELMLKNGYLIFIDTSSLMNYNMFKVLKNEIIPFLKIYNAKIHILDSVINEINKHIKTTKDEATLKQAKAAQYVLKNLAADNLYVTPESISVNKYFADAHIISHFTDLRTKYNLCLITNDNSIKSDGRLAGSILYLKDDPNIENIKDIKVYYINKDGDNPKLIKFDKNRDSNFILHAKPPERVLL